MLNRFYIRIQVKEHLIDKNNDVVLCISRLKISLTVNGLKLYSIVNLCYYFYFGYNDDLCTWKIFHTIIIDNFICFEVLKNTSSLMKLNIKI